MKFKQYSMMAAMGSLLMAAPLASNAQLTTNLYTNFLGQLTVFTNILTWQSSVTIAGTVGFEEVKTNKGNKSVTVTCKPCQFTTRDILNTLGIKSGRIVCESFLAEETTFYTNAQVFGDVYSNNGQCYVTTVFVANQTNVNKTFIDRFVTNADYFAESSDKATRIQFNKANGLGTTATKFSVSSSAGCTSGTFYTNGTSTERSSAFVGFTFIMKSPTNAVVSGSFPNFVTNIVGGTNFVSKIWGLTNRSINLSVNNGCGTVTDKTTLNSKTKVVEENSRSGTGTGCASLSVFHLATFTDPCSANTFTFLDQDSSGFFKGTVTVAAPTKKK